MPAAPSSQVEQSQNFSEYLAAGNLSLTKDMLQHIMSTAKAKGMLNFAEDALEWKDTPTTSSDTPDDADMEDTDNAAKKIPTNESEHFANRLHYERRARKARGKWKSALERLNKQQTTVDDLKQQLAEAEEELENANEHVEN